MSSDNTGLSYNLETSLGVAGTVWNQLEPNNINTFGAVITTVARDPIRKQRQLLKGTVTDLDSSVEIEVDLTGSSFIDFVEGFLFSTAVNRDIDISISAVVGATDDYTIPAASAAQAAKLNFVTLETATLIYVRGHALSVNNGLKQLDTDVVATNTAVSVTDTALADETSPANAILELAGQRSLAGAIDLTWDYTAASETAQLISAGDVTDWGALGVNVGQFIHVGSPDGAGGVTNAFENGAANDMFGYARVITIAGGTLTLDKLDAALKFDDLTAPTTAVDILWGKFVRNVPVDSAEFLERSFQFEAAWENLEVPGPGDEYEYALGNFCNQWASNLPLTDKATATFGFVGTDTEVPTTTRKTGADTPIAPVMTEALNTSSDIGRLRITEVDETGLTTDFNNVSLTFNNNVSPEKVLGQLGAKFLNFGNFEVSLDATILFTDSTVISVIRQNTTVTMDFRLFNDDLVVYIDVPAMTLGGGARELPRNETVRVSLTGQAFQDPTLGTSIGVSFFPPIN